jgi:hypothetical protein
VEVKPTILGYFKAGHHYGRFETPPEWNTERGESSLTGCLGNKTVHHIKSSPVHFCHEAGVAGELFNLLAASSVKLHSVYVAADE